MQSQWTTDKATWLPIETPQANQRITGPREEAGKRTCGDEVVRTLLTFYQTGGAAKGGCNSAPRAKRKLKFETYIQ